MVDQTDRLALDTYAQGEDNWDHTDTVELFDELAIDKGPLADRPSSGSYDDQFFYATDQRTLWRWDAGTSDWNAAAGLGANGDPIPGTSYFEDVDAGSVKADQADINQYSALLEKTTNQSISASTDTTVDWDNQTLDTDIYSYDDSTDVITVETDGDYYVNILFRYDIGTAGDKYFFRVEVNNSQRLNIFIPPAEATQIADQSGVLLKDLSANDEIKIIARCDGASTLIGDANSCRATISKEA